MGPRLRPTAEPLDAAALAAAKAPLDDEVMSAEDVVAIAEARAEVARGEVLTLDEVRRTLGLAPRR